MPGKDQDEIKNEAATEKGEEEKVGKPEEEKADKPEVKENIPSCVKDPKNVDIVDLLDKTVKEALAAKASDIHFEPRDNDMVIRFRIDGMLSDHCLLQKEIESALVFKIKVSAQLRTDEHFAPQDGRIKFMVDDTKINTRVSVLPTTKGEKVVFRLLTDFGEDFTLKDLGFNEKQLEIVQKNYRKPYGLIVAAGPTGSGKTTTLYTILKILNSREININTVEDPVEYDVRGVNHVQVNPKADLTFATGLRSLLRQDPDVLMIGEIRDPETASIAINSAMTGHLVLSTIHTNDAVTTVPRFVDMGVAPYLVSSTVNLVIAQRLGRRLCKECKKAVKVDDKMLEDISRFRSDIAKLLKKGETVYTEVGCEKCGGNGYKGRVGLYEVLELNEELRETIANKTDTEALFKAARKQGFIVIVEDGIDKIRSGLLSVTELIRVTALKE